MNGKENNNTLQYIWLAVGLLLFLFVGGRWSIPAAAWLAPVFLVRFSRGSKNWISELVLLWLGLSLVSTVSWYNTTPVREMSWFAEPLMFAMFSILSCVPYGMDRVFFRRWSVNGQSPFWVTLVFPVCFTAIDYISTAGGLFVSRLNRRVCQSNRPSFNCFVFCHFSCKIRQRLRCTSEGNRCRDIIQFRRTP